MWPCFNSCTVTVFGSVLHVQDIKMSGTSMCFRVLRTTTVVADRFTQSFFCCHFNTVGPSNA